MSMVLLIPLLLVGLAAVVAIPMWLTRRAYIKSLESRGWTFVTSPAISITRGLNNPPFGVGFSRRVDDQIIGRSTSGVPFQAFEYDSTAYRSASTYVITMPLQRSLPEFYLLTPQHRRAGIDATLFGSQPLLQVGLDQTFVRAAAPAVGAVVPMLPQGVVPDFSIDHATLVMTGVPKPAEAIAQCVEAMAAAVQRLDGPEFEGFHGEEPHAELGFYHHPHWVYRARDDGMLDLVAHTRGGQNHRAVDIMMDPTGPLPVIALTHTWETTRTETYTDGEGHVHTRTVTDHHSEDLEEFHPQFAFGPFSVNVGMFGPKHRFESGDFNQRFAVRCPDAKFASDVFHPRMMEFMLATNPPPFQMTGDGRLTIRCAHDIEAIEGARRFLTDFFSRVPNFVWENLGARTPPFPLWSAASAASAPPPELGR